MNDQYGHAVGDQVLVAMGQVLAEALFELAHYIDIKADFYDTRFNLNEQFNKLIRQQSVLADRQQASRDLILRALSLTQFNRTQAAALLGISFRQLRYQMQKLDIHDPD